MSPPATATTTAPAPDSDVPEKVTPPKGFSPTMILKWIRGELHQLFLSGHPHDTTEHWQPIASDEDDEETTDSASHSTLRETGAPVDPSHPAAAPPPSQPGLGTPPSPPPPAAPVAAPAAVSPGAALGGVDVPAPPRATPPVADPPPNVPTLGVAVPNKAGQPS